MINIKMDKKEIKQKVILGILLLMIVLVSVSVMAISDCSDGIDNDLDGMIDYPEDSGCSSDYDRTESIKLGYADGCLVKGDVLKDVFGDIKYACKTTRCSVCVLMTEAGNYTTLGSRCSGLPKCGFSGGGGSIELDVTAPGVIVNSPNNEDVFDSRKVLFDIELNEVCSLYYIDNINGKGRWKRMTGSDTEYYKSLSLKDGFNSITIKATDLNGNPTSVIREFTVDSKKPKISKTYPKKKSFASGLFEVQFKEENPVNLVLHFNGEEKILDVVADCKKIKTKTYCDIDVDLSVYDGASINYFFELIDIAGNVVRSKPLRVNVDITKPVVLNPDDFWEQGEAGSRYARYVYFDIEIDEDNFDEVSYFYEDSRGRMREKRLCSRLKEGVCEKKKSFRRGDTLLNIQVVDEAGNVEIKEIGLEINY